MLFPQANAFYSKRINQNRARLIKRRGADKKEDDVMDMCKLMLSTEPEQMPTFVARDLVSIPYAGDMCDTAKVCRDLEAVKSTILQLSENQESLANLVHSTWKSGPSNSKQKHVASRDVHTQCEPSSVRRSLPGNQPVLSSVSPIRNENPSTVNAMDSEETRSVSHHVPMERMPSSEAPSLTPVTTPEEQNDVSSRNNRTVVEAAGTDSSTHPSDSQPRQLSIENTRVEHSYLHSY